jgi:starch phosphorylase
MLVQGSDVWLNTPRPPLEASGTSGMKAGMNGALNCSVGDGWWPEAYDGKNGWLLPSEAQQGEDGERDSRDAQNLYRLLEEEIAPLFYQRDQAGLPRAWIARMRHAIATIGRGFSSDRMVRQYTERTYRPLASSGKGPRIPEAQAETAVRNAVV